MTEGAGVVWPDAPHPNLPPQGGKGLLGSPKVSTCENAYVVLEKQGGGAKIALSSFATVAQG